MFKKPVIIQRMEGIIASLSLEDFKDDSECWEQCQCAFICGVSPQTFGNWIKKNNMKFTKIGQTNFISGKEMRELIIKCKDKLRVLNVNLDDIKISEQGRRYS